MASLIASFLPAASGAATAGAGAAAAAGSVSTLSQALSIGSGLASIFTGLSKASALKAEAAGERTRAAQEEAAGAQKARDLSREYAELVGEQQAIQAANGVDLNVGTAADIRTATQKIADRNISITRENARARARAFRTRARGLSSAALGETLGGFVSAGVTGARAFQATG